MDAAVVTPIVALVIGWGLSQVTDAVRGRRDDRRERLLWRRQVLVDLQPAILETQMVLWEINRAIEAGDTAALDRAGEVFSNTRSRMDGIAQRVTDDEFLTLFKDWQNAGDAVRQARTHDDLFPAVQTWGKKGNLVYRRIGQLLRDG